MRKVAKQVGVDHGYLSKVLSGRLRIPTRHAEAIADALRLAKDERTAFLLAVHLDSAPPFCAITSADFSMKLPNSGRGKAPR